jgi:hypothetical protein
MVEWRCDSGHDACLLLRVHAGPDGPTVELPRQRLSSTVAQMNGRSEDERKAPAATEPLSALHRLGAFGPLACRHRVIPHASSHELQQDYDQAVVERRLIRRFLH